MDLCVSLKSPLFAQSSVIKNPSASFPLFLYFTHFSKNKINKTRYSKHSFLRRNFDFQPFDDLFTRLGITILLPHFIKRQTIFPLFIFHPSSHPILVRVFVTPWKRCQFLRPRRKSFRHLIRVDFVHVHDGVEVEFFLGCAGGFRCAGGWRGGRGIVVICRTTTAHF